MKRSRDHAISERSFTLAEILVVVVITPILLAVLFSIMNTGNQIYSTVTASMDIRQNARNAMERIVREVRESNSSTVTTDRPNADRVSFTTPRFKDAYGVQQPLVYFLNTSGQVIREYPPGTLTPVASGVTSLVFVKTGPQLDIAVTTAQTADRRPLSYSIKQKVRLRNE